jgi:hypothetical protein
MISPSIEKNYRCRTSTPFWQYVGQSVSRAAEGWESAMKWALHIEGNPIDLENWVSEFSSTSDPQVRALPGNAEGEQTYVLGWSGFDSAITTIEVVHLAKVLVRQMNGLVACRHPDSEMVRVSGKVGQIQDGSVLWHQVLQANSGGSYRVRGATATLKISGASAHPTPKLCLSWMKKCGGSNDALGDAVNLLGGARD